MLITGQSPRKLETSMDFAAILSEHDYCPYKLHCGGHFNYTKHAFDKIGAFDNDEEGECAKHICEHNNVNRWLRNLSQESAGGFSLPLSPGNFFPDFIVELADGRTAIVEYKGRQRAELSEEQHKKEVGDLWAARSGGNCVFAWIVDRDWDALKVSLAAAKA
jgi:type III restriction enzyme